MKDWRTLTAENGIIARYLLRLDAARIEQWNRDLVRMLLQGGRKMKLREEAKEAMAMAAEARGFSALAADIRAERTTQGVRCVEEDEATAVLEVIDQYEEVEVRECEGGGERWHWLRMPGDTADEDHYVIGTRTIYMRKPEPAPDLKELARRAVKAWRSSCGVPVCETMEALEKELDE